MSVEFGNQNNIPDAERQAFIKALVSYYCGVGPIRVAFDPVEPGLIDRYYRRKKRFPDEMEEIEREAAAKARQERSIHQQAFEARQERASQLLREKARDILLRRLDAIKAIVKGGAYEVEVLEYNPATQSYDKRRKTVIIYPRDQIAAFKALAELARHGILPEKRTSSSASRAEETERRGVLKPFLSVPTDFSRVSVTTASGRRVEISATQDGEVIEGEIEE